MNDFTVWMFIIPITISKYNIFFTFTTEIFKSKVIGSTIKIKVNLNVFTKMETQVKFFILTNMAKEMVFKSIIMKMVKLN